MADDRREARRTLWGAVLFVVIGISIGSDLLADYLHGASLSHLVLEVAVVGMAVAGGGLFARRWLALRSEADEARAEAKALRGESEAHRVEAERWKNEAKHLIDGLGAAIDDEFERWGLSPAESEIGRLLLKGLSHHEIADLRGVSERTARQQAQSLYKKAGLPGRAGLSAYFLEDLLGPREALKAGAVSR
jgi:DNA-binding CsgD family transcriptional regulator